MTEEQENKKDPAQDQKEGKPLLDKEFYDDLLMEQMETM